MKSFNATDAKNRFGELLVASSMNPVLVTKNGSPVAYIVPASEFAVFEQMRPLIVIKSAIDLQHRDTLEALIGFSQGKIPRQATMQALGLSWYGDLLEALAYAGLPLPLVSKTARDRMVQTFLEAVNV